MEINGRISTRETNMATKSSTKRKPFSNLTNLAPKPHHHLLSESKKRKSNAAAAVSVAVSPVSGSSIGSSQNPNHVQHTVPSTSHTPNRDSCVADENRIAHSQRQTRQQTKSNKKDTVVPVNQTSIEKTRNDGKERSMPVEHSTSENIKDQGKGNSVPDNQPSLEKMKDGIRPTMVEKAKDKGNHQPSLKGTGNDGKEREVMFTSPMLKKINDKGKVITLPVNQPCLEKKWNTKEISVAHHCSSAEKIKDKGKAIAMPLSCPPKKKAKSIMEAIHVPLSGVKIHDMSKESDVAPAPSYPLTKNTKNNTEHTPVTLSGMDKDKAVSVPHRSLLTKNSMENNLMPNSATNMKDKGKAIVGLLSNSLTENAKNNMGDINVPISGVKINDKGKAVVGSNLVALAKKDKGKAVATTIGYHSQDKDKGSSCPPLRRTRNNRNEVNGAEDTSQSKSKTVPLANKKKRRCSSTPKNSVDEYVLPQDFVEQQRAYFKEIDEFELPVEEV